MPLPFFLGAIAVGVGLFGVAKGVEAHSNNSAANDYIRRAKLVYEEAQSALETQRVHTASSLERLGATKVNCWASTVGGFLHTFGKFKNVHFERELGPVEKLHDRQVASLKDMTAASLTAQELLKGGVGALGAGALAGIASLGGAVLFAKASTGTAIAALTGIAAKNATLAWFGGGALAAKGLGVAGGVLVLNGIFLGPVLAVAGTLLAAKSEENLAKAKLHYEEANNAAEKMATVASFLSTVSNLSAAYNDFIVQFGAKVDHLAAEVDEMHSRACSEQNRGIAKLVRQLFGAQFKVDYSRLAMADKRLLHFYCLSTQVLHGVLAAPMLDKNGNLDKNAESTLQLAQEKSQSLLSSAQL